MDAAGKVIGGAWKEQVRESGCGSERLLNALTVASPDGALETRPLLPGSTIADPQLQRRQRALRGGGHGRHARRLRAGRACWTRAMSAWRGSRPGPAPPRTARSRPWTEIWTLQACAKRVQVEMHFKPDATGTDIRANPAQP